MVKGCATIGNLLTKESMLQRKCAIRTDPLPNSQLVCPMGHEGRVKRRIEMWGPYIAPIWVVWVIFELYSSAVGYSGRDGALNIYFGQYYSINSAVSFLL